MLNLSRRFTTKKVRINILGNPVRDAYLDVDAIDFQEQRVLFHKGETYFDIAYRGEPIRFGEKRFAQMNLASRNLASFTIRNGGGVYHTSIQLATLCAQRQHPALISAIDSVNCGPELTTAYAQKGINHISLGLEPIATNLILTNGHPDRIILKSPDLPLQVTDDQLNHLRSLLSTPLDLLVVNSPKSIELARVVLQAGQKAGAAQYSVLTPSLPIKDRIELLLTRDRASVCNLSEFALIAKAFNIDCPSNEETSDWKEVAQAMTELARLCKMGDFVVTLGAQGCLAGDQVTGMLHHIKLHSHWWQQVQEHVRCDPERKNGVGDRFFGSFVLAHALPEPGKGNRTMQAACRASLEMVGQLAPTLSPKPAWLDLHQFSTPFCSRKISPGRTDESRKRTLFHPVRSGFPIREVLVMRPVRTSSGA